jgi:hypothetical protein
MPYRNDADTIFGVYEKFLKSLRPRLPRDLRSLFILVVMVVGPMTLCHWLFKKPVLPGELDLTRIALVLGYIGLMLFPFFRSLLIPSASRLMHYKSQARKDEAMIQELRTASLLERRRFQKYLSEELRIEEKHDEL